jgi:hypothetical protein
MMAFEKCKQDFGLNDDSDTIEIPLRLDAPESDYYDDEDHQIKLT